MQQNSSANKYPIAEISDIAFGNIRTEIDPSKEEYKRVKNSIEKKGLQVPIIIDYLDENNDEYKSYIQNRQKYGIIDGHLRFRIMKELGNETIYAVLKSDMANVENIKQTQMIANWSKVAMSKDDKAQAIVNEIKAKTSINEIANNLGISRQYVHTLVNYYCRKHPEQEESIRDNIQGSRKSPYKTSIKHNNTDYQARYDDVNNVSTVEAMQEDIKNLSNDVINSLLFNNNAESMQAGLEKIQTLKSCIRAIEGKIKGNDAYKSYIQEKRKKA